MSFINQLYLERRTKYFKINDEIRRIIIFEVIVMNNSLKTVCEIQNINFSSAKNVIQIFKKEGRLEKKVMRARKNKKKSESKSDSDLSDDESQPEKVNNNNKESTNNNSSCPIMLHYNEDDTLDLSSVSKMNE